MKAKSSSKSSNRNPKFAAGVERALIRAEEAARRAARMYGTPLYVWENGKVVAKRPLMLQRVVVYPLELICWLSRDDAQGA